MLLPILVFLNVLVLASISILHFYWVFGGKWAVDGAIPDKFKDSYSDPKNKMAHAIATLVVALGLLVFATFIVSNFMDLSTYLPTKWTIIGSRIIGSIFLLRAIGDFNIFGLFKKDSSSLFAINDNKFYIPICLFLGITAFVISFLH